MHFECKQKKNVIQYLKLNKRESNNRAPRSVRSS